MRYDLIVLGNDPKGCEAALLVAQLRKRVAVISHDELDEPGNVLREVPPLPAGDQHRVDSTERSFRHRQRTLRHLRKRTKATESKSSSALRTGLLERGVDVVSGQARFTAPHEVEVVDLLNGSRRLQSDKFLIAVGSRPLRPSWVPFDGETIFDSDEFARRDCLPKSMIVVGADPFALEQAMKSAALGTRVAIVDSASRLLEFCDRQMADLLRGRAESDGVLFRLGRSISAIEKANDNRAVVRLAGGKNLIAECVLYASSRRGRTDAMNLKAAKLMVDEHGRLWCNEFGQTWVEHIYGIGEVVGFPTLANESLEQAHRFAQHAFGQPECAGTVTSFGISTIPELAMVGATEEQLQNDLVAYEVGVSQVDDGLRGDRDGSAEGTLKLLFHRSSRQLLGVHCLSKSAKELIRIGQTVMSLGGSIEAFCDGSLHDPELFDCYRRAAEDGLRRMNEEPAIRSPSLRIWRPDDLRHRRAVPSMR